LLLIIPRVPIKVLTYYS